MNHEPLAIATRALRTSELALARGRPRDLTDHRISYWLEGTIPIELVARAATPSFTAFAYWLVFVLFIAILLYAVVKPLGWVAPQSIDGNFYAVSLLATLCLILSRPSALGLPGEDDLALSAARVRWPESGELDESERTAAQFFLNLADNAAQRRVVALWWVTGATWAVSAYLSQKGFEARNGTLLSYALMPGLVSLAIAGVTAAYARSVNHVHALAHALLFPPPKTLHPITASRRRIKAS